MNLRLQLPQDIQLHGTTNVSPLGKVRYTAYASTFLYRPGGPTSKPTMYENVVRGCVVDETGEPIFGAALRVDGELLFTDSQGIFLVRRKKAKELRLEVLLDQFMFPGAYKVLSVPRTVKPAREELSEMNEVVLRKSPSPSSLHH